MEQEQSAGVGGRLARIEGRLKTIQICLYILLGWIVLVSSPMGAAIWVFVGNAVVMAAFLAGISLAFIWAVSFYQDWKMGDERDREEQMIREFTSSSKTPDRSETD